MNLEYQIQSHEYIEAEQLKLLRDRSFLLNLEIENLRQIFNSKIESKK